MLWWCIGRELRMKRLILRIEKRNDCFEREIECVVYEMRMSGHGWLLLRRCIDDDLYDRYWWVECVFVFSSTMRERERERFIFRLIEELLKWLSIGIEKWVSDFKLFSNPQILFSFFFFFFLCSSPPHPYIPLHPPSTQNILYFSHVVHPDDYGSDCVDDDCCLWRWHTSTSWHYFKSLFIEQGWSVCLMLWELWQRCYHHSRIHSSQELFYF